MAKVGNTDNDSETHKFEVIVPKGALAKARAFALSFAAGVFFGLGGHDTEFWRNNHEWMTPMATILGFTALAWGLYYWIRER